MGFKENVEALLSRSHKSQRGLAAAGGISSSNISQVLSTPVSPTLATVTRITTSFGPDAADIVRDKKLPAPGRDLGPHFIPQSIAEAI